MAPHISLTDCDLYVRNHCARHTHATNLTYTRAAEKSNSRVSGAKYIRDIFASCC